MTGGERPWYRFWPDHVGRSLAYPDAAAWSILERNLPHHARRVAIRYLDHQTGAEIRQMSYAELARAARRMAGGLQACGIRRGDRVALYLPNTPELVVAYFGTWMAGAVAVPCNPMSKAVELEYQVRDSGARLLVAGGETAAVALTVAPAAGVRLSLVAEAGSEPGQGFIPWAELLAGPEIDPVAPEHPGEDLALLLYTGGTTGQPKGAMLTHRNVVVNTEQFSRWYKMEVGGEICVAVLPLCHSGGMSGAMNVPLVAGATLLLFRRFHPPAVLSAIQRYRATRFFGVPTMYVAILNTEGCRQYNLASLRACRTGAAALPVAVKAAFDELAGREVLVEGYGLSETSPLVHANPLHRAKAGSIGIPISDTDACILNPETGERVAPGGEGELCLRGPQVMKGYWQKPAESAAAFAGGWFRTGDIARMDADGYFYVVDRLKDVIISSGFKVWPREVEEVLFAHPGVRLAAVVGVPDLYRGEAVKAFVVPRNAEVTDTTLLDHCRRHLANYKVPRSIEFRAELPTSGAGKVLRRVLKGVTGELPR